MDNKENKIRELLDEIINTDEPLNLKEEILSKYLDKPTNKLKKTYEVISLIMKKNNLSYDDYDDVETAIASLVDEVIRIISKKVKIEL